jgi:hypothetical protein
MQSLSLVGGMGWLLCSFLGTELPIGVPPEKEEPVMAYVAPEQCILYASWSAMATPNANSPNQTEQLLAEPEVQSFAAALVRNMQTVGAAFAKQNGAPTARAEKTGKSIGLWVRTLFTRSGALYLSRLTPRGETLDVQGALIVKAGDMAGELEQSITDLVADNGIPITDLMIGGRKFRRVVIRANTPIDVVWSGFDGYFMVGLGPGAIEEMIARIRAQKEPAWLTQMKANLPVERRSTISYVNIKRLLDTFLPLGGRQADKAISVLGVKQIISFQAVTGLDKTGLVNRSLLAIDGQSQGLLKLLDEKGISSNDLKPVPADALTALAFVADLRKIYDIALAAMKDLDPQSGEQAKQAVAQLQTQLGLNVPEFLSALGSHWTLHFSASGGVLGGLVTIEVRDKNRLLDIEKLLLSRLANQAGEIPNVGRISRSQFGGQTVSSLTPRTPNVFTPSWCIAEKQLIVGLNVQAVKSTLSRQPGEQSLGSIPAVAGPLVMAELAGANGPLWLTYQDTPRSFPAMYAQLQSLLPVLGSSAEKSSIAFDLHTEFPSQRSIGQHVRPSVTMMRRTAKGLEMESHQTYPGLGVSTATTGVAVALLLPAVQAAREAARRMQSANHIKEQIVALQNYHQAKGTLPPAFELGKDGNPLLSWRVAILPFLGQKELYNEFHLDEPWNSEHNKRLFEKMPRVFRSPNSSAKSGMTTYLGVGGPHGVLGRPQPSSNRGVAMSAITDGPSNTIAIIEANDALAVEWTKPVDWVPDASDPLKGLLGVRPSGFLAGFADGHIELIMKSIDPEMFRRGISRDDGQPFERPLENAAKGATARPPQRER